MKENFQDTVYGRGNSTFSDNFKKLIPLKNSNYNSEKSSKSKNRIDNLKYSHMRSTITLLNCKKGMKKHKSVLKII